MTRRGFSSLLAVCWRVAVFWNAHAHREGEWDMAGPLFNYNLTAFLDTAARHGLFVNLRIGPYVCAEWVSGGKMRGRRRVGRLSLSPSPPPLQNFGGYPYWITRVPGLVTRTSAPAWEAAMSDFFAQVINVTRPYFADRGGPIAMAQVENELHTTDTAYVTFCGALANEYMLGNQWGACAQLQRACSTQCAFV
jgi:beta-galactosidase GanA